MLFFFGCYFKPRRLWLSQWLSLTVLEVMGTDVATRAGWSVPVEPV